MPEKPGHICKPFGSDKRSSPSVSGLHTYAEAARVSIIKCYLRDSDKSQLPKKFPQKEWVWVVLLPDFLHIHRTNGKTFAQHAGEADNTAYSLSLHRKHPLPRQAIQALGSRLLLMFAGDRRLGEGHRGKLRGTERMWRNWSPHTRLVCM